MYSGVITIDSNRIRFSARDWKSMLAMRVLSDRLRGILAAKFGNNCGLSYREQQWMDIWEKVFYSREGYIGIKNDQQRRV